MRARLEQCEGPLFTDYYGHESEAWSPAYKVFLRINSSALAKIKVRLFLAMRSSALDIIAV